MVLAAKIFEIRQEATIQEIASKLSNFRVSESYKVDDDENELITQVSNLSMERDSLKALLSKDKILMIPQRGKFVPILRTIDATVLIRKHNHKTLLSVLQEKHFANAAASLLSQALFITYDAVVEAKILPETLQEFHERNPEATKVIYFDNMDIPSVNKIALYGETLKNSSLYEHYLSHGKIWYMVFTARSNNLVLGLTRNCVVTSFSRMNEQDFIDYIVEEVFPLIS